MCPIQFDCIVWKPKIKFKWKAKNQQNICFLLWTFVKPIWIDMRSSFNRFASDYPRKPIVYEVEDWWRDLWVTCYQHMCPPLGYESIVILGLYSELCPFFGWETFYKINEFIFRNQFGQVFFMIVTILRCIIMSWCDFPRIHLFSLKRNNLIRLSVVQEKVWLENQILNIKVTYIYYTFA